MKTYKMRTKKSDFPHFLSLFLVLSVSFVACEQEVVTPEVNESTVVGIPPVWTASDTYRMHAINCMEAPGASQDYEPYVMTISRNSSAEDAIFLTNFAGLGHSVRASSTGSEFNIPYQVFQINKREYRLRGSGQYSSDEIAISYKMDVFEDEGSSHLKFVICEIEGYGI